MVRGKGEGGIYQRADGLWAASIELPSHDGKRRRKVITSKSKAKVIQGLTKMRRSLEQSGDLPTASMTVAQWLDYWLREIAVKNRRPKTLEAYRSAIKTRIVPVIGNVRLDKLTPQNIRKVTSLTEAEKSSTYARNVHAVMSAAFKDAEREGRIPRNPVELVQAPLKAVTNLHALTPDEAIALLDVFKDDDEGVLWATFILTGARRGEVLGLEWNRITDEIDLSWQLQRITEGQTIPAGFEYRHLSDGLYLTRPKTRSGWRVIPLVDPLKGILDRYRDRSRQNDYGLLFTRENGQPIDPDHATKTWPRILEAAGISKHVRVHDLRHTTVDLLYAAGLDEDDIKAIVGHSSRAMSRSYKSKANQERLRASMVQFARSLES
jgi:integrase